MQLAVTARRKLFFGISGVFIFLSLCMMFLGNINFGIDMTGGVKIEYSYSEYEYNEAEVSSITESQSQSINESGKIINSTSSYKITGEDIFVVEGGFNNTGDEKEIEAFKVQFRDNLNAEFENLASIEMSSYTNIGASFGDYIKNTAIITLLIAVLAIAFYIAYAFSGSVGGIPSLSFAAITLVTLFHDVIVSSGLYLLASSVFPQFQIDTFFVTALLTILGYSINDTIVVFDRIRSNLKEFGGKTKDLEEIINLSVTESFTRSMYTSLTLAFVLVCILLLGPETISGFTLTMLFGTLVGTYSSICIASPLLFELHKKSALSVYVKQEDRSEEDKIVV